MKYKNEILTILNNKDDFTTAETIASMLKISKRTVSNVVNSINANQKVIISTNKGYKLACDPNQVMQIIDSPSEREEYIIWTLLNKKDVLIYQLADELNVSHSTIRKDITKLKKMLNNDFSLDVVSNNEHVSLSGLEENIRKLFDWRVRNESQNKFTTINFLQSKFPMVDVLQLKVIVQSVLQRLEIFVNDFQLISLILHLCIIIQRTINNNYSFQQNTDVTYEIEYNASKKIFEKIAILYPQCIFTEFEIRNFSLLLAANSTKLYSTISADNLINKDVEELTDSIIKYVKAEFNINLSSNSFRSKFMIHLDNLVNRLKNNVESKNDLVLMTKTQFPLIYDIATSISFMIKERYGYNISDTEISFIAFHVGNEIDEQIQNESLIKCAVIAPDYQEMNYHLANKLTLLFQSKLVVISVEGATLDQYAINNIDLIITTIEFDADVPSIVVHPFLSVEDIDCIEKKIKILSNRKKNKTLRKNLFHIFNEKLFIKNKQFDNEKEAIHYMCGILEENGFIDKDFEQRVISRENLSSTAFGDYAIPHPIVLSAKKTAIFVLINENPIPWWDSQVNFVFLICINVNEKELFRDFFFSICNIMLNDKIKQKLLKTNDFEQFIQTIQLHI
ncbi:MAG: BglG family transcription antiterminator [Erysipelotrichaceae bacterium]